MATCQIPGHADTYGLGIRISFYIQWFGMIITCWYSESDALNLKFLNALTILATSIGLALNLTELQPAEVYVVLLLLCGTIYFMVPIYLWRVLTCCHSWWDPERWTRTRLGWFFRTAMALMFGVILGFQIWFWCSGVYIRPSGTDTGCQEYGFFLGQLLLNGSALTALNIIIHIAMIIVGIWLFCAWIGMFDDCRCGRKKKKRKWRYSFPTFPTIINIKLVATKLTEHFFRVSQNRIESLQQFRTISDFMAAAIVTTAVELVISWNNISNVNDVDTAAQLIPAIISAAYFLRSIYLGASESSPDDSSYVEYPYWEEVGGPDQGYTPSTRTHIVYESAPQYWPGQRDQPRRQRRHSRHTRAGYDAGQPEMYTAYGGYAAAANVVPPGPVHENA